MKVAFKQQKAKDNLLIDTMLNHNEWSLGSGCGSVGRAVASDSRQKNYIEHFTVNCIEKTKIKKKRLGRAHFLKKTNGLWKFSTKQNCEKNYPLAF